jgi:hypothetical protein
VSDANDQTPVSDANDQTPVSDANDQTAPEIRVLKGNPTDAEIAALVTVLAGLSGAPADTGPVEINLWGHPVDKLRYPMTSWQRITLLERTHVRR